MLAGCTGTDEPSATSTPPATTPTSTSTPTPTPSDEPTARSTRTRPSGPPPGSGPQPGGGQGGPAAGCVDRTLRRLGPAERAAQLLMVGVPADASYPPPASVVAVRGLGVGAVILTGRSSAGVRATADLVRRVQALSGLPLEVAVDQEGGQVQVLSGSGFATIPDAREQGDLAPDALRRAARSWGRELAAAGVSVNLAPVADVVPAGRDNDPIGDFDREYGSTPAGVARSSGAFAAGMTAAGIAPVVKHFPGLGRASGNTDTAAGVVDTETGRRDPYLRPFRAAVADEVPYVMAATATYRRIDPNRLAAFSPVVLRGLLRGDLGYDGLVVSDDLGVAAAVQDVPVGQRATRFVTAGGDVVLTVVPEQAPAMVDALVARARGSDRFAARLDAAARRVLARKAGAGLLGCARAGGERSVDSR